MNCLLMHLVYVNKVPQYLVDSIATVAQTSAWCGLGSGDTAIYFKPRTRTRFGERGFRFTGHDA